MLDPLAIFAIILIGACGSWMFASVTRPPKLPTIPVKGDEADEVIDGAGKSSGGGFFKTKKANTRQRSEVGAVKIFSPKVFVIGVLLGIAAGWVTKWPAMGLLIFIGVAVSPMLNTKNSQRQKNVVLTETVASLCDSIISLIAEGRKITEAVNLALKAPTLEFEKGAKRVRQKMEASFAAGLEELRVQLPHSLCDVFCSTLYFVATSEASGRAAETLQNVSKAATESARMEKRIVIEQRKGYTTARTTMFISLVIMVFQGLTAGDTFEVYDGLQGQIVLLGVGFIMAVGVWLTVMITRGKSMLRISFPIRSKAA